MDDQDSIEHPNGNNESLFKNDLLNNSNETDPVDRYSPASRNLIDCPMIQNQLESEGSDEDMESQSQKFD